jgi:hypothetical protein
MATKKGSAKKSSGKKQARGSGPREKIKKMYGRREPAGSSKGGQFSEMDNIGPSLAADRRKKAKKKVKPGYGDQGDQPKKSNKGSKLRKAAAPSSKSRKGGASKKGGTTLGGTTFKGRTAKSGTR